MADPSFAREHDLAIVGSGGAAFAAAIAARRRGLSVVMVERGTVGGTCVNVGCIPSKALLAAADARHRAGHDRFPGIWTTAGAVDMQQLIAAKDDIVGTLRGEKYLHLIEQHGIELVVGDARFSEGPVLQVGDRPIEARHYLVATGADPAVPDIPGTADAGYLTSTTAMELDHVPESLVVIGGGYVAMELAQLFARLGSEVTMLVRSRLAREEEPEVAEAIREVFTSEGIRVLEGATTESVARVGDGVAVSLEGDEIRASRLLVATGRRPRTAGLRLAEIGVGLGAGGEVVVDGDLSTTHPRVWAAGDVTGHPQFVYVAAKHGGVVVENAFEGAGRRLDYRALPRITFTTPAVASAGLTEAQAREQGIDTDNRVLGLEHVPRAIVTRDTRGLVKLVTERGNGRVIGVHMVADGAGDVILAASLAVDHGMTVDQLAEGWNPYLTLGEALFLAAQSFTRDPSSLSCCAA